MYPFNLSFFLHVVILASSVVTAFGSNISSNTFEKVRTVVSAVVSTTLEITVMRDTAVVAVRNAIAAENDAEELLLSAVKSGDKQRRISARKNLDDVSKLAGEGREMLQKIADYADEVTVAAGLARQYEKDLSATSTERDVEVKLKKIQKLSTSAVKVAKDARILLEILKKQWLLPVVSQTAVRAYSADEGSNTLSIGL